MHNISTLNDIAIYTYEAEVPLREVFLNIFQKEEGKKSIDPKSSKNDLLSYFGEVLPGFDDERVYASNIKKVLSWYNALVDADFDFATIEVETEEEESSKE